MASACEVADLFSAAPSIDRELSWDQCARERFGLPAAWTVYILKSVGPADKRDTCLLTGAVVPPLARGKNAGTRPWKNRDKSTEATVAIKFDDYHAWCIEWERDTGKCHKCKGTGQQWHGWSKEDGSKYRPCPRCGSTGRAPYSERASA